MYCPSTLPRKSTEFWKDYSFDTGNEKYGNVTFSLRGVGRYWLWSGKKPQKISEPVGYSDLGAKSSAKVGI
jgi:hypothetical protein